MRIRSIRPEFWASADVAEMDWHTRLVYIGLWSYVDDNGVGRDVEPLIIANLFPLDTASMSTHGGLTEVSVRVHGALKHLETLGCITRYTVEKRSYLHVVAWSKHQVINRPGKGRYPLPTCEDAITHGALSEPSVSPHENASPGEGEKGRRGEGEKEEPFPAAPRRATPSQSAPTATTTADFGTWWERYPKKTGKLKAAPAYAKARKGSADQPPATAQQLLDGLDRYLASKTVAAGYVKDPATWLNGGHWSDELDSSGAAPAPAALEEPTGSQYPVNPYRADPDWGKHPGAPQWLLDQQAERRAAREARTADAAGAR